MSFMPRERKKLLIVGNGMATGRLLDELLSRKALERFQISVVGDEAQGSYNRIMLSPVLAQDTKLADIIQKPRDWFEEQGIAFHAGERVTEIRTLENRVCLQSGGSLDYDELVLATGSRPSKIPASGQSLDNIFSFRTIGDVETIGARADVLCESRESIKQPRESSAENCQADALVIGGGLLGLEAAYGLAKRGISVTLVHRSPWLLNRQLDEGAGRVLEKVMHEKGIRFELGTEVEAFIESDTNEGEVGSAQLANGKRYQCNLVVIATGITPNKELANNTVLTNQRGIAVNEFMKTNVDNISALGECCEYEGETFGLVEPIWLQCKVLADRLALNKLTAYKNLPVATKLKVSGVQVYSAGEYLTQSHHRELLVFDEELGIYRKLLLCNNQIVGIVLLGDTRSGQFYYDLMQSGADVGEACPHLIFGENFLKKSA